LAEYECETERVKRKRETVSHTIEKPQTGRIRSANANRAGLVFGSLCAILPSADGGPPVMLNRHAPPGKARLYLPG